MYSGPRLIRIDIYFVGISSGVLKNGDLSAFWRKKLWEIGDSKSADLKWTGMSVNTQEWEHPPD